MTVLEFEQWVRWWVQRADDGLPVIQRSVGEWIELPIKLKQKIQTTAGTTHRSLTRKAAGRGKP